MSCLRERAFQTSCSRNDAPFSLDSRIDLLSRFLKHFLPPSSDIHLGAIGGKGSGNHPAQSGASTRDYHDVALDREERVDGIVGVHVARSWMLLQVVKE